MSCSRGCTGRWWWRGEAGKRYALSYLLPRRQQPPKPSSLPSLGLPKCCRRPCAGLRDTHRERLLLGLCFGAAKSGWWPALLQTRSKWGLEQKAGPIAWCCPALCAAASPPTCSAQESPHCPRTIFWGSFHGKGTPLGLGKERKGAA